MPRPLVPALLAAALIVLAAAGPAAAQRPALRPCADSSFRCGTLDVPLDRTGAVAGRVPLRFAVKGASSKPVLFALSGGPGQPGVVLADGFLASLRPLTRRYRIVVVDQRGTGRSGPLRCPSVQGLRSLSPITPAAVAACAQRIGPRRAFYTTADTVLDLDALRAALGSRTAALMGVSYGTHVALSYARAFPDRVDRLILDSIVGPDGPDAFQLDTLRNLPRVLREQCAPRRCAAITADPVADLGAFVQRLAAGPVRGHAFDGRGHRRTVTFGAREAALYLVIAGDLNPFLQAALPAALASARAGDTGPLMRLRAVADGPRTPVGELSFGLNVTTGCVEDGGPPYPLTAPPAVRAADAGAALAAIPPSQYAPFDAATVAAAGYGDDCLLWPQDAVRAPFSGPLPDVHALLLGGRADLRTPVENALVTRTLLPHSTLVQVAGTGHDVLDSDVTGCAARALDRFARDRAVGTPCDGRTNELRPVARPPRTLADYRAARGVGGQRGRKLFAVLDTIEDARLTLLQRLQGGLGDAAGGLRGGAMHAIGDGDVARLTRYALLRGAPVSGTVSLATVFPQGTVRVGGRFGGVLGLRPRGIVVGRLGGRAVRYSPTRAAAAAATHGAGLARRVDGTSVWAARATPSQVREEVALRGELSTGH